MQWLGERSFSIYLMHGVVIFLLREKGGYQSIWTMLYPTLGAWAYLACFALTIAIVLPVSAITYALIERPGQKLGAKLIAQMASLPDTSVRLSGLSEAQKSAAAPY
jgi:peptidoglycan/LPS O-acetylase OafA/YrhL